MSRIERLPAAGVTRSASGIDTPGARVTEGAVVVPTAHVLIVAVFLALVVGFVEVAVLAFRKLALGGIIHLSQHFVWMAPAAYVLLFLPVALGLLVLMRATARVRLHHVVAAFAFLGAIGVLLMFGQLHRVAVLLLGLGVAVQAGRAAAKRPDGTVRLARRASPWLGGLALLGFVAVSGGLALRERSALAALGPVPANAKNVVLIILDTVRAASLSLYGYERPTTPNLERRAAGGIVFENAFSPSPWTLPSHASMFTGRYPHELAANWQTPVDDTHATLAEVLARRGYVTAGFTSNPFYTTYEHGLDRGFAHYEDYRVSLGQTLNSGSLPAFVLAGRPGFSQNLFRRILSNYDYLGRKTADIVTHDFLSWLDDRGDEGRPFFAFINYMDSHVPFEPPAEWAQRFGVRPARPLLARITNDQSMWTEAERAAGSYEPDRYDATIAFTDAQLDRLFEDLARRGLLDETVVVLTADHGEHLGEHELYGHANSLYSQVLHVPLVVWAPDARPARLDEYVTLRSLPATVLDLLGIDAGDHIPGESFAGLLRGEAAAAEDPLVASVRQGLDVGPKAANFAGDVYAITEDGRHYIANPDGTHELYDLRADPRGLRDVGASAASASVVTRLRAALLRLVPAAAGNHNGVGDDERGR